MWFVTLLGFLLITFAVGVQCQEKFQEVLPVSLSGLLLLLYILGLCGNLNIIALLSIIVIFITLLSLIMMKETGRREFLRSLRDFYLSPSAVCIILGLILISVLTSGHVATWWDDVNYWATDAKALYYLNGFTGKYGNVAPEFGDYPPGLQLMKWCFAKICLSDYKEGLSYAGYYCMNIIFCLPVLKKTRDKNILVQVIAFIAIFLLPGVCNDVWSHGACADVTMGIVYGAVLISIFDYENHGKSFYYIRIALLMSLLTLCKSVGFEWMIYSAGLLFVMTFIHADTYVQLFGEKQRIYALSSMVTAASVQASWWIYCLLNRRIAKLTSSGAHMAASGYSQSEDVISSKAKLFLSGFGFCPMHTNKTWAVDLSALAMLILIALVVIGLTTLRKLDKKEAIFVPIYVAITALIAYGIIFVGHITIFAGESQYDTAEVMAISISRYAAPFTIGTLMLLIFVITDRCSERMALIACAVFVLATTDYTAAAYCLGGYRVEREQDITDRESMVDDNGYIYAEVVKGDERLPGHRVLYFRDDTVIHWVKDTYINHEVAPVPTVYAGINPATMNADNISDKIKELHAEYIYIEDVGYLEEDPLREVIGPLMSEGEIFQYETVYKVVNNGQENRVNLIAK